MCVFLVDAAISDFVILLLEETEEPRTIVTAKG